MRVICSKIHSHHDVAVRACAGLAVVLAVAAAAVSAHDELAAGVLKHVEITLVKQHPSTAQIASLAILLTALPR